MKMADALIKAGKQFRMLIMPEQNHGPLAMGFTIAKDGTISLRESAGYLYETVRRHFEETLIRGR
jgi:dipeptidyl aminopeptidase/acylaminoacyl peptidase